MAVHIEAEVGIGVVMDSRERQQLIHALRWEHRDGLGVANPKGRCGRCEVPWPCPAARAADELEVLVGLLDRANDELNYAYHGPH